MTTRRKKKKKARKKNNLNNFKVDSVSFFLFLSTERFNSKSIHGREEFFSWPSFTLSTLHENDHCLLLYRAMSKMFPMQLNKTTL